MIHFNSDPSQCQVAQIPQTAQGRREEGAVHTQRWLGTQQAPQGMTTALRLPDLQQNFNNVPKHRNWS